MIYIASKTAHAPKWLAHKDAGAPINSSWIYEAESGQSKSLEDLWLRCIMEATTAHVLIAYREPHEVLKGALVEIGAALSNHRAVLLVGFGGDYSPSFIHHPLVQLCRDMHEAFTVAGRKSHACKWKHYR